MKDNFFKSDFGITKANKAVGQYKNKMKAKKKLTKNRSVETLLKKKIKTNRKIFLKLAKSFITPN